MRIQRGGGSRPPPPWKIISNWIPPPWKKLDPPRPPLENVWTPSGTLRNDSSPSPPPTPPPLMMKIPGSAHVRYENQQTCQKIKYSSRMLTTKCFIVSNFDFFFRSNNLCHKKTPTCKILNQSSVTTRKILFWVKQLAFERYCVFSGLHKKHICTGPDKRRDKKYVSLYCILTYIVGIQWNCLTEAIPLKTHNLCFQTKPIKVNSKILTLESIFDWYP